MNRAALAFLTVPLVSLALLGCGTAAANQYDSADPVHCSIVFSVTIPAARARSDHRLADEMTARLIHLARSQGGIGWLNEISPQAMEIAAGWEASPDREALLSLFDRCKAEQNNDPAFQAAAPALLAEAKRVKAGMP
jgi:hypothetical protein